MAASSGPSIDTTTETVPPLDVSPDRRPAHIAIIMDGNGRWAQRLSLPRIEGHRRATHVVRTIGEECQRIGVKYLTLYCLSSENWKRPEEELEFLIELLQQYLIEARSALVEENLVLRVIGSRDRLPDEVQREMNKTLEMTRNNTGTCVCLAVNYGGRAEIVEAIKSIAEKVKANQLSPSEIDQNLVSDHLYTAGIPDPDLVIRTAGEMRISNFLLWQISYSELWVTERCWPEFRIADLHQAIRDFAARQRRFGGLQA